MTATTQLGRVTVWHVTAWAIVLALVLVVLAAATIADTARRPQSQWQRAGVKRGTWLTLEVVFLVLFVGFGLLGLFSAVVDGIYFWVVRPKLQAAEAQGPP